MADSRTWPPANGGRPGPLRVLELDRDPIVRFCGKLLRGLGARVDRLDDGSDTEPPAADFFLDSGKSAEPVTGPVDGDNPVVARLAAAADVVLVAGRPDELSGRGLDYPALAAANPGVVVGRVSRFGDSGEWSGYAGGDYQAVALSGLMRIVGEPGRQPLRLGGTQADFSTAVTLFSGIQFALFGRDRTGQGGEVSTSAVRATAALDWKSSIYHEVEGKTLRRGSDRGPFVLAASDGHVGFYYRAEDWPSVQSVLGDPALRDERFATQTGRDERRAELKAVLSRAARRFPKKELYERAQARKIPVGYVMTLADLPGDAQFRARGALSRQVLPGGKAAWLPRPPWTIDGARPDWFGPAPSGDGAGPSVSGEDHEAALSGDDPREAKR